MTGPQAAGFAREHLVHAGPRGEDPRRGATHHAYPVAKCRVNRMMVLLHDGNRVWTCALIRSIQAEASGESTAL